MKISLNQKIKDLEGEIITTPKKKGKEIIEEDLRLSTVLINSLLANFEDEKGLAGEEKINRYMLAQRIKRKEKTTVDLTAENIQLIKPLVAKAYGISVVGKVWEILDK